MNTSLQPWIIRAGVSNRSKGSPGQLTISQFNRKIKDPALATVFNNLVHFGGSDVPLLTVLLPLAYAHRKMAGIPLHGWLSFALAMERRFKELGGKVVYGTRVEKLIIENGAVKGVILSDGARQLANRVMSAADGRVTYPRWRKITQRTNYSSNKARIGFLYSRGPKYLARNLRTCFQFNWLAIQFQSRSAKSG